jgi:hypothetical protein
LARAKRTDRTEARRRSRAAQLAAGAEIAAPEPEVEVEAAPRRRRGTAPTTTHAPVQRPAGASGAPVRPGIRASISAAYQPVDLRADLRALPKLLTHWSFLVTVAAGVIASGVYIVTAVPAAANATATTTTPETLPYLSSLAINMLIQPPPIGAAMILGFFAPRATWLLGLIYGVVAAICFSVILLVAVPTTDTPLVGLIVQSLILAPIGTMMFAAAISWYRRFLRLATPARPPQQRGGSAKAVKPVQGRGDAPRNRLSGSGR